MRKPWLVSMVLVASGCGGSTATPTGPGGGVGNHDEQGPKVLGPDIDAADFDADLADGSLRAVEFQRLDDGELPAGWHEGDPWTPTVDHDNVVSAAGCAWGSTPTPTFVVDSAGQVYVMYERPRETSALGSSTLLGLRMATPDCAIQRFQLQPTQVFVGLLNVTP